MSDTPNLPPNTTRLHELVGKAIGYMVSPTWAGGQSCHQDGIAHLGDKAKVAPNTYRPRGR